jgi:hypothetical protein
MRAREVPVMLTGNVIVVRLSGEINFFVTSADVVHSTRLRNPFGESRLAYQPTKTARV